jgi:LacI family transcriptional regulator
VAIVNNITQKEIAKRLGVSASLVSRALSGTASGIGASAETIERIRAEAAKLNYHPSAAALSLRGTSTHTIGVVIKNFDDPFFGHIIAELQTLAMGKHLSLLLTGCPPGSGGHVDIRSFVKYRLDGLIIAGSDFVPDGLDEFVRGGQRVVRIGSGPKLSGVANIRVDLEHGFRELVAYLTKLGHRDIGYLGDEIVSNLRREKLLVATIKQAGLVARPTCFVRTQATGAEAGYEAMQTLLKRCGDLLPTAVVAAEDALAQTALRALFEQRISVPQDLTLVGVDDVPAAQMTIPALTTLRQPIPAMVRAAFEQLTTTKARATSDISIQPELVIRESSAPPAPRRETHDE